MQAFFCCRRREAERRRSDHVKLTVGILNTIKASAKIDDCTQFINELPLAITSRSERRRGMQGNCFIPHLSDRPRRLSSRFRIHRLSVSRCQLVVSLAPSVRKCHFSSMQLTFHTQITTQTPHTPNKARIPISHRILGLQPNRCKHLLSPSPSYSPSP